MKKLLMVCAVSATTLLGSCTTIPGGPTIPPNVIAVVAQVQAYTKAACGFIPTAASIANILAGGNAGVMSAVAMAQAICNAILPVAVLAAGRPSASRTVGGFLVTPGKVNGIVIRGSRA